MQMAAVTATGVPNPAAPSKNAPKQNATSSNCRRRSFVMPVMLFCRTSNSPVSVVSWYMKITLRTIQPIGSNPKSPPRNAVLPGHLCRHAIDEDRYRERDEEPEDRRPMGLDVEEREAAQQHEDRQRR